MALISGSMYTDSNHSHLCGTYSGDYSVSRSGNTVTFTLALTTNTSGGYGSYYANVKVYYNATLNGQTKSSTAEKTSVGTAYYSITFDFPSPNAVNASCYVGITKEGYDGYLDGTNEATGSYTVPAGGAYNITVSFDGRGGTPSESSRTVINGSAIGTLPTATRTGYDFNGWWTDATGGTGITAQTTISGATSQIFYAHWNIQTYTISYDGNADSDPVTNLPSNGTKTYNVAYAIPSNIPARDKYIFTGYAVNSAGTGTIYQPSGSYTGNGNTIFYAQWKKANIPVYIKQNGSLFQIEKAYTKINNEVKECTIYTKVGGQIKPIT